MTPTEGTFKVLMKASATLDKSYPPFDVGVEEILFWKIKSYWLPRFVGRAVMNPSKVPLSRGIKSTKVTWRIAEVLNTEGVNFNLN